MFHETVSETAMFLSITDVEDATPALNEEELIKSVKLEPSIVARIKEMEGFECPMCYDAVPSPCFLCHAGITAANSVCAG